MTVIIVFLLVVTLALLFFVPSLVRELRALQNVDYDLLAAPLTSLLSDIQSFLYDYNILEKDQTLISLAVEQIRKVVDLASVSGVLERLIGSTASFFFKFFVALFITFFFLKDNFRLENIAKLFFSDKYTDRLTSVSGKIDLLLSHYCVGMLVKTAAMIVVLYVCFLIFGIKGALLLAFIGGVTNIIPYLGPIVGGAICSVFVLLNCVDTGMYDQILPLIIQITGIFIGANIIDNWLLQPYILSQSIKAHPVEIFLVTIIAGKIGGISGMVLGIPVYTIVRIIATELYHYSKGEKKGLSERKS
jgi:predicted PurR-regulated permease PerM